MFKCGKCQESFETGQQLQRHLRIHEQASNLEGVPVKNRNEGDTDNRFEYECYMCKCNYKKLATMQKHMNLHMKSEKSVFQCCSICRTKVDRTKMNNHVCDGQRDNIRCEYCSKLFTGTNKLLKHLDVAHKTKRRLYECEKSRRHFPMIFLRDFHQITHEKKPKEYSRSAKHMKIFDADKAKNHLCEECGRTFHSGGYSLK